MKKVTKVFSVMVASVALAAMLSGCGGDKKPAGGDTIKVGGNLEMTGGSASFGISSKMLLSWLSKTLMTKVALMAKNWSLLWRITSPKQQKLPMPCRSWSLRIKVVAVIGPNLSSATIAAGSDQ